MCLNASNRSNRIYSRMDAGGSRWGGACTCPLFSRNSKWVHLGTRRETTQCNHIHHSERQTLQTTVKCMERRVIYWANQSEEYILNIDNWVVYDSGDNGIFCWLFTYGNVVYFLVGFYLWSKHLVYGSSDLIMFFAINFHSPGMWQCSSESR